MKKSYVALALITTLLGGCATNPTTGVSTIDPVQVASIEAEVQKDAATVCGFVPTIGTVANVIASFAGAGAVATLATQAANAICSAVVPAKAMAMRNKGRRLARRSGAPVVNGVPIEGYFIR